MNRDIRQQYNNNFTKDKYEKYISKLENIYPGQLDFRVAETPVFVSKAFTQKMLDACESIIDVITQPEYLQQSEKAVPPGLDVPNTDGHPQFIAFDFGVCYGKSGALEPQLIEMQGFPSLFCWQVVLAETHKSIFGWPAGFTPYLNNLDKQKYVKLLKKIILNECPAENVILLELLPLQQKTRADFFATKELLGIETVCLTELIVEGSDLYYNKNGSNIPVKRIYNRVIFDDLFQQPESIRQKGAIFQQPLNVTWVPHPNWFYRYSKFSLPFIKHAYVPETRFLNEAHPLPDDLENFVVKPLFSFAGQGVIIDVTREAISQIKDPENWIIQKKVQYANAVVTPDENAKAEIRLFYFWPPGAERPVAANNLARLSKGKMVGVRYNKDKSWVGGTFCLFEQ